MQSWDDSPGPWAAIRSLDWKYVELLTGEKELYDMKNDPFETESLHDDPAYTSLMASLSDEMAPMKGLCIATAQLDDAVMGRQYFRSIQAWGGTPPYTWTIEEGSLPPGLELDPDGMISGTPRSPGDHEIRLLVEDSSVSPLTGHSMSHSTTITIHVARSATFPNDTGSLDQQATLDSSDTGQDTHSAQQVRTRYWGCSRTGGVSTLAFLLPLGLNRRRTPMNMRTRGGMELPPGKR